MIRRVISGLRRLGTEQWLAMVLPVVMLAPNIGLDFTEPYSWEAKAANVLLPLGFYGLLMGVSRRVGLAVMLMLPLMVFGAFQIVLLFLFGNSLIAVDMFLNVVTSNPDEIGEMLGNLLPAIATVLVIYVPLLVWGGWCLWRQRWLSRGFCRGLRAWSLLPLLAGIVMAFVSWVAPGDYSFVRQTFPVNVLGNLFEAVSRTAEVAHYRETSEGFTYNAVSTHPEEQEETYVLVIGETARAANWQLFGYQRPTTPRLSAREGIIALPRAISESNTTHKSVPMMLSSLSAETFNDSINRHKSVLTAFNEAGFRTYFFSNQRPNSSYTEFYGDEANGRTYYVPDPSAGGHAFDEALLQPVAEALADTAARKKLIVVHTYGAHFAYSDRYPTEFARFTPDAAENASRKNRQRLVNGYDNSMLYTDFVLDSLVGMVASHGGRAALLYASDHGEDIYDDATARFLHASPLPSARQIHVAAFAWLSDSLRGETPRQAEALSRNARRFVSPQKSLFHTLLDLSGVSTPYFRPSLSLAREGYTPAPAVYLNDLNESLPVLQSGLNQLDLPYLLPLLEP